MKTQGPTMKSYSLLLLILLCHGVSMTHSHALDISKSSTPSSSSSSFIPWIPTVRGGSHENEDKDPTVSIDSLFSTTTSNTMTRNLSLDSLQMYRNVTHAAWIKQIDTCTRCQEMEEQITSSLSNLNHDIMILSIRTTMLPSDLLPHGIVELYHQMKMLQVDATMLLSRLNEFHTIVKDSQLLLQSLLERMEQVIIEWKTSSSTSLSLPSRMTKEGRKSSFIGRNWYEHICQYLLWTRNNPKTTASSNNHNPTNLDTKIKLLHQTMQLTFQKVDELQHRAYTSIWKDLQEIGSRVQEQVTSMDQLVKEMRDKSSSSNTPSEDTTTVEVEVQMSTYYWH